MVRKNQIVQALDPVLTGCDCNKSCQTTAEPVIPPIVPIVSVKSVDGYTGDVILKNLTVGDKVYNGTDAVTISLEDFGVEGAVQYRGARRTQAELEKTEAEQGDLYYCQETNEFWLATAKGTGTFNQIPCAANLDIYAKIVETGSIIALELSDDDKYKIRAILSDKNSNPISTSAWIDLPIESLVKDIQYDATTKEIVFILQDGTERRVPLKDLISGLQPEITEANPLKFNLVQGLPAFKQATEEAIATEQAARETADAQLQNAIDTEGAIRKAKDDSLEASINKEINDRAEAVQAEADARSQDIATEKAARIFADNAIKDLVKSEVEARKDADTQLQTNIDTEKVARENADTTLQTALATEETNRKAADGALTNAINKEVADRKSEITRVEGLIATEKSERVAEDTAVESRAQQALTAAKTELFNAIQAEEGNRKGEITRVEGLISDEKTARVEADEELKQTLHQEITDVSADLNTQIENERIERGEEIARVEKLVEKEATNRGNEIIRVEGLIADEKATRISEDNRVEGLVSAESSVRASEDIRVAGLVTAEETARKEAVKGVADDLAAEKLERQQADGGIVTSLTNETNTRISEVARVEGLITAEVSARTAGDNTLNIALTEEISRSKTTDETLDKAIKAEQTDRIAADKAEAVERGNADGALGERIDGTVSSINTLNTALTAEANKREEEDAKLQTQIDNIPQYTIKSEESSVYAGVYRLLKDGVAIGDAINIPKDQMLKNVQVISCTEDDVPIVGMKAGHKYLVFEFIVEGGQIQVQFIAIDDMIQPYKASDTITIGTDNSLNVSKANVLDKITGNTTDINNEITRAKAKETELDTAIATEQSRAEAEEAKKVDRLTTLGTGSKSYVSNNVGDDGAVLKVEGSTIWSAVSVNDVESGGPGAQIYDWVMEDGTYKSGSVLDITNNGIYYYNGDYASFGTRTATNDNKLVTEKQLNTKLDASVFTFTLRNIEEEAE